MHLNMSFSCIRFDKVKLKVNINAINYQYNCAHVLDVAHIHVPLVQLEIPKQIHTQYKSTPSN